MRPVQRILNLTPIYTLPTIPCTTAKFSKFPRVKRRIIPAEPVTDVYFTKLYKPQPRNLSTILTALKAYSLTEEDEDVSVSLCFNLLDKKSRPVQPFKGLFVFPHTFGEKGKICVFCDESELEEAKLSGADNYLSKRNFSEIKSMELYHDAYIATESVIEKIKEYQKDLRAKMPISRKGSVVSLDKLPAAVQDFLFKINYECSKTGSLIMPIGKVLWLTSLVYFPFLGH